MNKEKKIKLYILAASVAVVSASFFAWNHLDPVYSAVFVVIFACGVFFVFIEFYLRIQHNVDDGINRIKEATKTYDLNTFKVFNLINNNFANVIDRLAETEKKLDSFDRMFADLKNSKGEENISHKIEELKDFQNKTIVIMRQISEYQVEQTNFLKKQLDKQVEWDQPQTKN
jgi:hypothetical protein